MKKRALEEAQKYEKYILESRGIISDYGHVISNEIIRKEITYKDVEKIVKSSIEIIDTYMLENERYITIGEHKIIICSKPKPIIDQMPGSNYGDNL